MCCDKNLVPINIIWFIYSKVLFMVDLLTRLSGLTAVIHKADISLACGITIIIQKSFTCFQYSTSIFCPTKLTQT